MTYLERIKRQNNDSISALQKTSESLIDIYRLISSIILHIENAEPSCEVNLLKENFSGTLNGLLGAAYEIRQQQEKLISISNTLLIMQQQKYNVSVY